MANPTPSNLAFPQSEYDRRTAALRARMAEHKIDVLIIDEFEHLMYYTGYLPTAAMYQCCIFPLQGDPTLIVRALDAPLIDEVSWVRERILFDDAANPIQVLTRTLRQHGYDGSGRIGYESDSNLLTSARLAELRETLARATFVDFGSHMWTMRLRKSPLEIDMLRRCARICDIGTLAGAETAREGISEREVAAAIYAAAIRAGADNTRLLLSQSGPRSDSLHGALGNRILQTGDLLHIEMVPHVRAYTARSMRPVWIGTPDDETRDAAGRLIAAQDAQFAAMKPGALAGDIDRLLREEVLASGLRTSYTNITGYTLGLVAIPRTSDFTRIFLPNSDWRLESGMVFHMYTSAKGMSFSETIHVAETGAERLTQLPRRLMTA
ncbi:M24 family metallopeptidase [Paraburkholderia tropica]|uniref:M24 family metallopeptidase n=1 Tax=Paraburkholderia tropica TaxID=92647 RepID=UPI002AB697D5|nr:Xaa-Pro peptidase family protein [Paraburkholderia tropica]